MGNNQSFNFAKVITKLSGLYILLYQPGVFLKSTTFRVSKKVRRSNKENIIKNQVLEIKTGALI